MNTNTDDLTIPAELRRETNGIKPATAAIKAAVAAKTEATPITKPTTKTVIAPLPAPAAKAKEAPKAPKATKAAKPAKAKKAAKAEIDEDDEEVTGPRSIVPARFKAKYAEHDGSNGDKIALAFKSYTTTKNADGRDCLDEAKLAEVAKANGIDMSRYAKMNNGQKRMNVGNRLRGMLKQGTTVTIGGIKFADAAKALVVQPAKAKPAPKAKSAKAKPAPVEQVAA